MYKKFARGGALILVLVLFAVSAVSAGIASADNDSALPISTGQTSLGTFFTGADGHTLYVFKKDESNVSNCQAECQTVWPALLLSDGQSVAADASIQGTFGMINTPAGTQVTYNGAPLYYYAGDKLPGDTNGEGIGGVWTVAKPVSSAPTDSGIRGNNVPGGYGYPGGGAGGY